MPRVVKRLLKKEKLNRLYDDFWTAVALLETKEQAESFLFDLLTHTEREMLAKRFQTAMMLIEGKNYETIRQEVGVANSTIARVNNWLNTGASELFKISKILIDWRGGAKEEKKEKKRYLAGDLLLPAVEAGASLISRQIKKRRRHKK